MTEIRNDRTSRPRRRAGATLVLAAASGGLLAAAMAGSPTARADDPFTDITTYVQGEVTLGEAEYSAAATDFSTAGDTNEGLVASLAGFDNLFISPADSTLLGLVAAATNTNYSGFGPTFEITDTGPTTAAGQTADAATDLAAAQSDYTEAASFFTSGNYFDAAAFALVGGYDDILAGQADTLAALFSAGI